MPSMMTRKANVRMERIRGVNDHTKWKICPLFESKLYYRPAAVLKKDDSINEGQQENLNDIDDDDDYDDDDDDKEDTPNEVNDSMSGERIDHQMETKEEGG